jgi:hypothetical protein
MIPIPFCLRSLVRDLQLCRTAAEAVLINRNASTSAVSAVCLNGFLRTSVND